MGPLYKQLITASPSTLLDIKKLPKRSANLLKNRAWFPKHYPRRWGPNFFTTQGPESGAAERKFFVFWQQRNYCVNAQKCTTKLLDYRSEMYNEMIGLLLRNVQRNYSQQKLRTASRSSGHRLGILRVLRPKLASDVAQELP